MTGLLHRLAARATGTAWTVRSDARLPFGTSSLLDGEAEPDPVAPPSGAHAQARPLPPSRAASPAMPPDAHAGSAHPLRAIDTQAASPPALPPLAARPAFAADGPAGHVLQQPHATHAIGANAVPSSATSPTPVAQRATWPDMAAVANPRGDAPQPARAAPSRAEPAPLLPRVHAAAAQPGTAAPLHRMDGTARRSGASQHVATGQDTEVHIHIGRIDVTAVHEAPKPKPRARERTQPVSLDAYLAKGEHVITARPPEGDRTAVAQHGGLFMSSARPPEDARTAVRSTEVSS